MKRIFIFVSPFICFSSFAFDWSLRDSESIKDLQFFPKTYTVFAKTEFQSTRTEYTYGYLTQTYAKITDTENNLKQNVGLSLSSKLKIQIEASYNTANSERSEYGPASTANNSIVTEKSPGMKDPEISGNYLVKKQSNTMPMVDLQLSFSPSVGSAKIANGSEHRGNSYRGGSTVGAAFDFGKKYTEGQWIFGLKYHSFFKQTKKDVLDGTKTTIDSHGVFSFGGAWQWDWEVFSLQLGLAYQFNGETTGTVGATAISNDSYTTAIVFIKPVWNVVPNTFSLYTELKGTASTDFTHTEKSDSSNVALDVTDLKSSSVTLGALYSF